MQNVSMPIDPDSMKSEFSECFANLADDIRHCAGDRTVIYIPNPGNFGDGLIRYATKKFLLENKIQHQELNIGYGRLLYQLMPYLVHRDRYFFLVGGGGGWCKAYDCGSRIARKIARFSANYLVLPSTYETFSLSNFNHVGRFYRRDNFMSKGANKEAAFCHDMAFYLLASPIQHLAFRKKDRSGIGLYLRNDLESLCPLELRESSRDISTEGDHMSNTDEFLALIGRCTQVYTDRLHVCIGALITGTPVNLYAGNYAKIQDIYKTSIKDHFEQVAYFGTSFTSLAAIDGKVEFEHGCDLSEESTVNLRMVR